ncbi:hypothetical protein EST38_g5700 [Candolleomyces aberdarensis]|uniref:Uncharacterized protein n=1 Tax=Candolleomyces aberdarensis TaxID=2316362 RepID=A0A4Q2DLQ0_9AGAR|nr:hypothetical protein EST38_g5700 [Candolleomyces aberdarensis]
MASQRKTTVYDVTGLRVRPDGRRIDQNTTKHPRTNRYWAPPAVKDSQGNWIAADAGGPSEVSRFVPRKRRKTEEELDKEENDDPDKGKDEDLVSEEDELEDQLFRPSRKGKERRPDRRPSKRKKFKEDQSFMQRVDDGLEMSASFSNQISTPTPEFLKSIHHFAAQHYSENGFLLNSSKEYRQKRKRTREFKAKAESSEPRKSESPGEDDSGEETGNVSDESSAPGDTSVAGNKRSRLRGPGRPKRSVQHRDMYRVLDGSALVALGVLVQEYVRDLIETSRSDQNISSVGASPGPMALESPSHVQASTDSSEKTLLDGDADELPSHAAMIGPFQ